MGPRGGFSLIELLAVVTVIAVLIALILPALGAARYGARLVQRLSEVRQLAAAVLQYTDEADGVLPTVLQWGNPIAFDDRVVDAGFFSGYLRVKTRNYVMPLRDAGYDTAEVESWDHAREGKDQLWRDIRYASTTAWLSNAFAATPRFWRAENPPLGDDEYRGMPLHSVRYPSDKGLLLEVAYQRARVNVSTDATPLVTVDGAGRLWIREPAVYDATWYRPHGGVPWPVVTTPDGVEGRDVNNPENLRWAFTEPG